jgi:hypothetical protein
MIHVWVIHETPSYPEQEAFKDGKGAKKKGKKGETEK